MTSAMATIDHEHNHFKYNAEWIAKAKESGFNDFGMTGNKVGAGRAFVEASNYHMGLSQAEEYGYSEAVKNYLTERYENYSNWQSKLIIEAAY